MEGYTDIKKPLQVEELNTHKDELFDICSCKCDLTNPRMWQSSLPLH